MSKAQLYQKINRIMGKVGKLNKDGEIKDKSGKKMYSYLSEEQTTSTLQNLFVEEGLVMFPVEVHEDFFYIEGMQYDKPFKNPVTKVNVKYKIVDTDTGEFEIINTIGYGTDNADKGSNKAMTGAFKYAQRQTFMIASGEDGDHTASEEITQKNTQTAQKQPKKEQQNQQPTQPINAKSAVINLKNEMKWEWDTLAEFATDVLGRPIKKVISDIKSEEEWKKVEQAMIVTKQAS